MSTQLVAVPTTFAVGGKPHSIRFANGAFYLLSTWGIDVTQIATALNEKFQTGHYTEVMYKLAAASLGNFDASGNWKTLGLDPLEFADRLLEGEAEPLMEAVWKAFSGKLGLVTKTPGPEPAQTPDPSTNADGQRSGPSEPALTVSA